MGSIKIRCIKSFGYRMGHIDLGDVLEGETFLATPYEDTDEYYIKNRAGNAVSVGKNNGEKLELEPEFELLEVLGDE